MEQIKSYLKAHQEFADIHGKNSVLASIGHEWSAKEFRESRIQIQSSLRGRGLEAADESQWPFYEAAIFMEMARDLDEREMDLETGFARVESLEEEFREILGITSEEESEEVTEVAIPALGPRRAYFSYLLQKRICFWLRLFCNKALASPPALVAMLPEVLEEMTDPAPAAREFTGKGKALSSAQISLACFPRLDHLPSEIFSALIGELQESELLGGYWRSMEKVIKEPQDSSLLEELQTSVEPLRSYLEGFCEKAGAVARGQMNLALAWVEHATLADVWKTLDKGRRQAWSTTMEGESACTRKPVPVLLYT